MHQVATKCFDLGSLTQEWALGLVNCIFKCLVLAAITTVHPIAL